MAAGDVDISRTNIKAFRGCLFDGVDDKVQMPASVYMTGHSFSISFWLYIPVIADADNERIIRQADGGPNGGFNILYNATTRNKLNFTLLNISTTTASIVSSSLSMRTWYHVVCLYDKINSVASIYINGAIDGTDTSAVMTKTSTERLYLGSSGTNQFGTSILANICMYKRVLSQEEITALAADQDVKLGLEHQFEFKGNYTDSITGVSGTATGTTLSTWEDSVGAAVAAQRTTANDKWLVIDGMGGDILTINIEEAP